MIDLAKTLFITDMDGTLLPADKKLNPADIAAIEEFRCNGGHFSVATGRSLQSASQYFNELKLDEPIILCNGGGVYDCREKRFVWQKFVDTSAYETVKKAFEHFPNAGGEINYSDGIKVPHMSEKEKYHLRISYGDDYCEVPYDELSPDGWCKMLFAAEEDEIPLIAEYLRKLGNDKIEYVQSSKIFYEILPKGCTKGYALGVLKDKYSLDDWTLIACGDFDNDLEMIKKADIGFAPANAQECIKSTADHVTEADCSNGAIAEVLNYVMNVL